MQPTYFLWSGLGPIEDLDGDDDHTPLCVDRQQAIEVLRAKYNSTYDWTLWENVAGKVTLIGVSVREPGGRATTLFI